MRYSIKLLPVQVMYDAQAGISDFDTLVKFVFSAYLYCINRLSQSTK